MADTLFWLTHVPLRKREGILELNPQTASALVGWGKNFDRVTMAGILWPNARELPNSRSWMPVSDIDQAHKFKIIQLPYRYRPLDFIFAYETVRRTIQSVVNESDYLCFTLGGLIGDWGAIACLEAMRLGRKYAVQIDRVEYKVLQQELKHQSLSRRFYIGTQLAPMKHYHQHIARHSAVALLHGQDTFAEFAPLCRNPVKVFNTHAKEKDQIVQTDLIAKIHTIESGHPLNICYAGRASEMKGPLDWLKTLDCLNEKDVDFKATWFGDGPLLNHMKTIVEKWGLQERVKLPGFIGNHSQILQAMKESHIFLFCHKTPESPRCLIEALISGCPIVGYQSPYPIDLVCEKGGGAFVSMEDWAKLASKIFDLNQNRYELIDLVKDAALSGQRFNRDCLYQQRSKAIKEDITAYTA